MTLIAAWRTPAGIIIHADSQETIGDYRVQVDKINTQRMGRFNVLIAGAGSPSSLVDAFPLRLSRRVNDKIKTLADFAKVTEKTLVRFYEHDVGLCPDDSKNVIYLIAAYDPEKRDYEAWIAQNVVLQPIPADSPILLGWDHQLYIKIARMFYSQGMNAPQAIVAGVHLMSIAEDSSNYIKGPIRIAAVSELGIELESEEYGRRIQDRLKAYENEVNKVFLNCSDTTVSLPDLEESINKFRESVLALHREQIDELAHKADGWAAIQGFPLRQLPNVPLTMLDDGGFEVEHDREAIARNERERRERMEWVKSRGIDYLTKQVECAKCHHVFEAKIPCAGPNFHLLAIICPSCSESCRVEWVFDPKLGDFT